MPAVFGFEVALKCSSSNAFGFLVSLGLDSVNNFNSFSICPISIFKEVLCTHRYTRLCSLSCWHSASLRSICWVSGTVVCVFSIASRNPVFASFAAIRLMLLGIDCKCIKISIAVLLRLYAGLLLLCVAWAICMNGYVNMSLLAGWLIMLISHLALLPAWSAKGDGTTGLFQCRLLLPKPTLFNRWCSGQFIQGLRLPICSDGSVGRLGRMLNGGLVDGSQS